MYFSELSSSPCPDRNLIKPGRIKLSHTHEQFIKSKHRKSQPWMDFDDFFFFVYSLVASVEKIYQTSAIQKSRISSKIFRCASNFQLSSLSEIVTWIKWDEWRSVLKPNYLEKRISEFSSGSRTHDFPEYR